MVKVMEFVFQLPFLRPRVLASSRGHAQEGHAARGAGTAAAPLPPSRLQPGWKTKQQLRSNRSSPDVQGEMRLLWWGAEINTCV